MGQILTKYFYRQKIFAASFESYIQLVSSTYSSSLLVGPWHFQISTVSASVVKNVGKQSFKNYFLRMIQYSEKIYRGEGLKNFISQHPVGVLIILGSSLTRTFSTRSLPGLRIFIYVHPSHHCIDQFHQPGGKWPWPGVTPSLLLLLLPSPAPPAAPPAAALPAKFIPK